MSGKGGYQGSATFFADPRLQRVSTGWVDKEMVTIRKMAAAGATADEMGAAVGKKRETVIAFIRRNRLVWNQKSLERHCILSAAQIEANSRPNRGAWRTEGIRMREAGASTQEIADAVGVSEPTVREFFKKRAAP